MAMYASAPLDITKCGDFYTASLDVAPQAIELARLCAQKPESYPYLLESSAGRAAQSRYDILLSGCQEQVVLSKDNPKAFDFFTRLDTLFEQQKADNPTDLPFIGGWFIYLGYELAAQVEPKLNLSAPEDDLPVALAVYCNQAIIYDRHKAQLSFISQTDQQSIHTLYTDWQATTRQTLSAEPVAAQISEQPGELYIDQVKAGRNYIAQGDIFQTNLSRLWHGKLAKTVPPARLYAALKKANPAPFAGLMLWHNQAVISSSPERLLQRDKQGWVQTRPIAGTRPRNRVNDQQAAEKKALMASAKDHAEHGMIIDLERNDLGKICTPGTIEVNELMVAETYEHVHHIVSNVRGQSRPEIGPGTALKAMFPGGTITGCPKVRCMEIIAEQEALGRGAYTGSFGYLSRDGQMDTNILIRTITQQDDRVWLRAGAGIVMDSDPGKELQETRAKALGVLKAFAIKD